MRNISLFRSLVAAGGGLGGVVGGVCSLPSAADRLISPDFDTALGAALSLLLLAVSAWLLLAVAAVAVDPVAARRLAPAWLVAALTTGAVLAGGAAQANPQGLD
ncbi:MAG: hypothetical protein QM621_06035, partial [Aeromicrobium sp.]|uniref:hypothetical protein n=1 Tax=Aeromicrobium sp. TaxID=1871063 RepID=UPI0039E5C9CE